MKCPGQDTRYWKAEDIFEVPCPTCGNQVEFFRDEPTRPCGQCGNRVVNPRTDFACAAYCRFAEQCLGELPPELIAHRGELLKQRVAIAMKKYFQTDFKRIGHAGLVARYAEEILKQEKEDPAVVVIAAYLHDIGIKAAEQNHEGDLVHGHETLGPGIARQILLDLGAQPALIDEVSDIIAHHHHPRPEETGNFKVVFDADQIVNLEADQKENPLPAEAISRRIEKTFLTETGKSLARDSLFAGKKNNRMSGDPLAEKGN